MTLNYRLSTPHKSSLTLQPGQPDTEVESVVLDIVLSQFARASGRPPAGSDFTPEILSDKTITRIEALEDFVEQLRNALIDAQYGETDPEVAELLDEVDKFIGYEWP